MSDILIAGGGPGGLLAALALGQTGAEVTLVDPAPAPRADSRSTAFLAPSVEFLLNLGLWGELAKTALPLEALTLIDAAGSPPEERLRRTFRATDHGLEAFAQNVPNDDLNRVLMAGLGAMANVRLMRGVGVTGLFTRTSGAEVKLTDGTRLPADAAVGFRS